MSVGCGILQGYGYIAGWSVDTTQSLLRGEELEEALNKGSYSPYIGELLKQKADEGVTVNMLVWDDATSNPNLVRPVGFMGTQYEQSKAFFEGSSVDFRLAPMQGDEDDSAWFQMSKFTHQQKIVVLDAACKDDEQREPLAFVGGIDLTTGRWDKRKRPLTGY
jgi:phospholipase D1/2